MFLDCFEYFFACTPLSLSSSGQLVHAGVALSQLTLHVSARGGHRAVFGVISHRSKPKGELQGECCEGQLRRQPGWAGSSGGSGAVVHPRQQQRVRRIMSAPSACV